jgi:hypothetical protein
MSKFLVKSSESVTYETWVEAKDANEAVEIMGNDGAYVDRHSDAVDGSDFEIFEVDDEEGNVVW